MTRWVTVSPPYSAGERKVITSPVFTFSFGLEKAMTTEPGGYSGRMDPVSTVSSR